MNTEIYTRKIKLLIFSFYVLSISASIPVCYLLMSNEKPDFGNAGKKNTLKTIEQPATAITAKTTKLN